TGAVLRRLRGSEVLRAPWAFTGVLSVTQDKGRPVVIAQCRERHAQWISAIFLVAIDEASASGPLEVVRRDGGSFPGADQACSLGTSMCGLSDLDADGVLEFAVSAPHWRGPGMFLPWAS